MNRYKFTEESIQKAVKFLKDKAKTGPTWAKKYKPDLSVSGTKVLYKGMTIIPQNKVDDYLRTEMFRKDGTLPFGRDAAHHKLKTQVVGVTRRHLMRFIKKQPIFEQTKAAVPQAKRKGGRKLKKYTFETDLVFIRKNDLVNSNKHFDKTVSKEETYMVSTVEKSTGLCRLDYVKSKFAAVVTPIVLKHIRSMAKELHAELKDCSYRSDSGGEFDLNKIRRVIPDTKTVVLGSSVEKKNQDAQRVFYRLLKSRRSVDIPDALRQTQALLNETYNRIQGGTPNEIVAAGSKFWNISTYNNTRKKYVAGDRRNPFEVGQRVRIQIKKEKGTVGFKSYKGETFSKKVYIVKKVTKSNPPRYWVNGKWLTQDKLLGSAVEDEKTKLLVKSRDEEQQVKDQAIEKKAADWETEKAAVMKVVKEIEIAEGSRRRTRSTDEAKIRRRTKRDAQLKRLDERLEREEAAIKQKKRRVVPRGRKYEREAEEEWLPSPKKRRKKPRLHRV